MQHVDVMAPMPSLSSAALSAFYTLSEHEVKSLVMNAPTKSDQNDPLPTWLLKQHLQVLLPSITGLVNLCIQHGMPGAFKQAIVHPLLKKRGLNCDDLKNYRPVSALPFISKVVERAISSQMVQFLERHRLLDPRQSAYRPLHSCETATIKVLDSVFTASDSRMVTLLVFLDMSSAFDTVNHSLLMRKLCAVGLSGETLDWFNSYLNGRSQSVAVNSSVSSPQPVRHGVPQGSVLGPLLFSVYLLGIGSVFQRRGVQYMLYADDIQFWLHSTVDDFPTTVERARQCVDDVQRWLRTLTRTRRR